MVIKENFGRDMVECLIADIMEEYKNLESDEKEEIHKLKENLSLLY